MGFRLVRSHDAKPCPVRLCKAEVFVVGAGVQGGLPHTLSLHVHTVYTHIMCVHTYVHTYIRMFATFSRSYVHNVKTFYQLMKVSVTETSQTNSVWLLRTSPRSQTSACAPLWYQYVAMSIYNIRMYDPGCHMQCVRSCRCAISLLLPLSHFQLCPTQSHFCHYCHISVITVTLLTGVTVLV